MRKTWIKNLLTLTFGLLACYVGFAQSVTILLSDVTVDFIKDKNLFISHRRYNDKGLATDTSSTYLIRENNESAPILIRKMIYQNGKLNGKATWDYSYKKDRSSISGKFDASKDDFSKMACWEEFGMVDVGYPVGMFKYTLPKDQIVELRNFKDGTYKINCIYKSSGRPYYEIEQTEDTYLRVNQDGSIKCSNYGIINEPLYFTNKALNGPFIEWKGKIGNPSRTGTHKNGELNGFSVRYDRGDSSNYGNYKNGKKEGIWTWMEDYTYNSYSGKHHYYYKSRANYENGKLNGTLTVYRKNGSKREEITYENNKKVGAKYLFRPDGKPYGKLEAKKWDFKDVIFDRSVPAAMRTEKYYYKHIEMEDITSEMDYDVSYQFWKKIKKKEIITPKTKHFQPGKYVSNNHLLTTTLEERLNSKEFSSTSKKLSKTKFVNVEVAVDTQGKVIFVKSNTGLKNSQLKKLPALFDFSIPWFTDQFNLKVATTYTIQIAF